MPGPEILCVYHVLNARQERIVKVIRGASARVTSSEPPLEACPQSSQRQVPRGYHCHPRSLPLRTLNSMKIACLIQDTRWVELKNLIATREGGSCITADLADQNVSPNIGDACLVIDGEEFAGNVVRHTESQVIFESDRFEEIAKRLS
jgi:hypothetical protein